MNSGTKLAALNKFRTSAPASTIRQPSPKVLVVYDIQVKSPEVPHVPLVINYGDFFLSNSISCQTISPLTLDLPKAVEEYSHR